MISKIITIPNPILRQKSKPVQKVDKKVLDLIKNLEETLESTDNPKGIGISAPQIGIPKRVLIMKLGKDKLVIVNPKITFTSKEMLKNKLKKDKRFMEGCLSVPELWGFVDRPYQVKVVYLDENGIEQKKDFIGKNASLFQHEYDHLDGILFIDRVLKQKGKIYKTEKNEKGEIELVEVKLE